MHTTDTCKHRHERMKLPTCARTHTHTHTHSHISGQHTIYANHKRSTFTFHRMLPFCSHTERTNTMHRWQKSWQIKTLHLNASLLRVPFLSRQATAKCVKIYTNRSEAAWSHWKTTTTTNTYRNMHFTALVSTYGDLGVDVAEHGGDHTTLLHCLEQEFKTVTGVCVKNLCHWKCLHQM